MEFNPNRIPEKWDLKCQDFHQLFVLVTFPQRNHNPHKVILFEEPLMSTFRKHIVFLCIDVSGGSCDGLKMIIFGEIGARPSRDLRDPRKKRPKLNAKTQIPQQAGIALQIWAETVHGARRTKLSKRAHKIRIFVKKNCPLRVLNFAWGLIYV